MQFCEETLSTFPKHPADTWSNIAPVVAGVAILVAGRGRAAPLRMIGWAAIITGVFSAVYHATNTYVGEVLDLSGMYFFIFACAGAQLYRRQWLNSWQSAAVILLLTAVSTALAAATALAKTPLFAVVLVVVIVLEITDPRAQRYHYAYWAVGVLAVAFAFWVVDYSHVMCDPNNHVLTGHGMWHLLNGPVFYLAYLQFAESIHSHRTAEGPMVAD